MARVSQESSGEVSVEEIILEYPTTASHTNVQGRVILDAIIATDGSLHEVRLSEYSVDVGRYCFRGR